MIAPDVLELAENANTYTPLGPTDERIVTDRYVLWMGRGDEPGWNVAQRFRFRADELAEVRGEIHQILRDRGRTACSWEVGSSATPDDLVERLHALGLVDDARPARDRDGAHGAARRAPARGHRGSPCRTPAERLEAPSASPRSPSGRRRRRRAAAPPDPEDRHVTYLAYVDGEPVPAPRRRFRSTA